MSEDDRAGGCLAVGIVFILALLAWYCLLTPAY